ncbi:hypothetical protein HOE49_04330 [Candidatus Peregrinibacteria bacterium]|jgi:hypothetical protein|nr:hypothetical protein [Candidatus Peregrinibacteria bacterium]MBT4148475.1 hypothetical protein [Candidatus Peregrinibacteria bacterium]
MPKKSTQIIKLTLGILLTLLGLFLLLGMILETSRENLVENLIMGIFLIILPIAGGLVLIFDASKLKK